MLVPPPPLSDIGDGILPKDQTLRSFGVGQCKGHPKLNSKFVFHLEHVLLVLQQLKAVFFTRVGESDGGIEKGPGETERERKERDFLSAKRREGEREK